MPTDPAVLAQLQSLWHAAGVQVVPPAVSAPPPPESPPEPAAHEQGEVADDHQQDIDALRADHQSDGVYVWPDDPVAADLGPFADLDDADREYLLGPRFYPSPCSWCGGRYMHNPDCVSLSDDWALDMPFGKHKGQPIRNLDTDYLVWLVKNNCTLTTDVAQEIERVLMDRLKAA